MKSIRGGAWVVLLLLTGIQAWSARFYATPDGVSYLDLSDAVVSGNFSELLNAYWSPLYPALIGIMRLIGRPSPYWEFAVAHLLNWLLFIASLLGYEYFLSGLRKTGGREAEALNTTWGTIGAYALFGAFSLLMTPLTLPTPDLLVSAACFFTFGALVRIRLGIHAARAGIVLGIALAAGSLAKSFIIPWTGVCLIVAFVALRRQTKRPAYLAAAIWLAAALPWTIGLSMKTGHLTFGDTGRLTYIWYVNQVETPSRKEMPSGAATPATDSILGGVAITPNAPGTNPVWYDPARWYSGLNPRFDATRQANVFTLLIAEYIASLAPLVCVVVFWMIVAGGASLREWWMRSWVVIVPAIAAIAAYSLVLVTSRYVAPFYIAMTLMFVAGMRWPERIVPGRVALAIAVPLAMLLATPNPARPAALLNAAVGAVLCAWLFRYRTVTVMVIVAILGAVIIRMLQTTEGLAYVALFAVLLVAGYWVTARESERRGESDLYSALMRRGLLAANTGLILFVGALKYNESLQRRPIQESEQNDTWFLAKQAEQGNIKAGDRVALVGSPFEAYWARMARVKIVAVVSPSMAEFYRLSPESRRRLYDEFAKAGANRVIVQQSQPPDGPPDRTWAPVSPFIGWVKSLR